MAKKDKKKNDPEPVSAVEPDKKDKKKKKDSPKKEETLVRPKKKAVSPEVEITEQALQIDTDSISLRAYFIGEQRQRDGIHGDSHGDWVEAERQLHAEAKKARKKK